MLSLPDGTYWGRVDAAALAAIAARWGAVSEVLPHYRGTTCAPPRVQHLDRVAFGEHAWGWFDAERSYVLDDNRVRVDAIFPDGTSLRYCATSRHTRTVTIGGCLDSTKSEEYEEYELSDVTVSAVAA
jgi:hypothetical protein